MLHHIINKKIETDENMIDENGRAVRYVNIKEDCIVCHPKMYEKVKEAQELMKQDTKQNKVNPV